MLQFSFLGLFLAFSLSVFAHGGHDHHHDQEPENLKELGFQIHHEMETPGAHSSSWREKLKAFVNYMVRPDQTLLRILSVYNRKSEDTKFGEAAKDLVILLPFSETLEIYTGPKVTQWLMTQDFHWAIDATVGGGAWLISLPFVVEPYCGAVILTYAFAKPFRWTIRGVRVGLSSMGSAACSVTGLSAIRDRYFPVTDQLKSLLDGGWILAFSRDSDELVVTKQTAPEKELNLVIKRNNGYYVTQVNSHNLTFEEFNYHLKGLPWSVRQMLKRDFKEGSVYQKSYKKREVLIRSTRKFSRDCSRFLEPEEGPW